MYFCSARIWNERIGVRRRRAKHAVRGKNNQRKEVEESTNSQAERHRRNQLTWLCNIRNVGLSHEQNNYALTRIWIKRILGNPTLHATSTGWREKGRWWRWHRRKDQIWTNITIQPAPDNKRIAIWLPDYVGAHIPQFNTTSISPTGTWVRLWRHGAGEGHSKPSR